MNGVAVVGNPTAGGGNGRRVLDRVVLALRAMDVDAAVVATQDPGHPARAAAEAVDGGASVLVAVGGDGLVGTCAAAVAGTPTALAVVPAGTGNDFARALGLSSRRPLQVLALLDPPRIRRVDAARVEGSGWSGRFVCVAGAGLDSETNARANAITRLRGTARYVAALAGTLASFRPATFTVGIDGHHERLRAMMVAVGNARSYGGGMQVCPAASIEDGLLDVTVIREMSRGRLLRSFPRVFRGTHVTLPEVRTYRAARVELDADRPFMIYGDGEPLGYLPATVTVESGVLRVVAP